jgi:hypothetical protein
MLRYLLVHLLACKFVCSDSQVLFSGYDLKIMRLQRRSDPESFCVRAEAIADRASDEVVTARTRLAAAKSVSLGPSLSLLLAVSPSL